jgi:hypothetical protein
MRSSAVPIIAGGREIRGDYDLRACILFHGGGDNIHTVNNRPLQEDLTNLLLHSVKQHHWRRRRSSSSSIQSYTWSLSLTLLNVNLKFLDAFFYFRFRFFRNIVCNSGCVRMKKSLERASLLTKCEFMEWSFHKNYTIIKITKFWDFAGTKMKYFFYRSVFKMRYNCGDWNHI